MMRRAKGSTDARWGGLTTRSEPALDLALDPMRDAPRAARRAVRAFLAHQDAQWQARSSDVVLLVSELVTNSVLHGEVGQVRLRLRLRGERLRVEVLDPGPGLTRLPTALARPEFQRGRGLALLPLLADRFGAWSGRPAVVWFELDLVGVD
jgi:anti-sigma regulatory factor (Ser/Thr protein kinase)